MNNYKSKLSGKVLFPSSDGETKPEAVEPPPQSQEQLVNRYWELLEPGGLLFTGHSESLTDINHRFSYVQPTIYAKP